MSLNVRCGDCGAYATWTPTGYVCHKCGWVDRMTDDEALIRLRDGVDLGTSTVETEEIMFTAADRLAAVRAELAQARAQVDAVRALHVVVGPGSEYAGLCRNCGQVFPCNTAAALDRTEPRGDE